jgi:hypothetical protein
MLGFSPLASAPLADDGLVKVELTSVSISTQAPSIANATLTQVHSLTSPDISTGTPTVGSSALTQVHSLSSPDISTGTPTVASISIGENYSLSTSDISTGTPTVGSTDLDESQALTPTTVTSGVPSVSSTSLTQIHSLTATDVTTQNPVVDSSSVLQVHDLSTADISTGTPVVGNTSSTQSFALSPNSTTAGSPVVSSTALSQVHTVSTADISTDASSVDTTVITQIHSVSLSDTTSGSPVTGSPNLDEEQSLTPSGITTGSPTLDSPSFSAFDLVLSANDLTAGTPDIGDERLAGYNNARNNFFNGTASTRGGYLETSSSYYLSQHKNSVPISSITETSSSIFFKTYFKRQYSNSSSWVEANVTLYKTGSTTGTVTLGSSYSGTPPNAGTSNHTDVAGVLNYVNSSGLMDWMDDSVGHSDSDSTAFPVTINKSGSEYQLKSGSSTYDTYTIPNYPSGTLIGFTFELDRWKILVYGQYTGNYYTASPRPYITRFNPPQPFPTTDVTLTHLLTGVGLLGFSTAAPSIGSPDLSEGQLLQANSVDLGTPTIASSAITQDHSLGVSDVEAQSPSVSSSSISQDHSLTLSNVDSQAPSVSTTDLNQDQSLQANGVTAQSHVISGPSISQAQVIIPSDTSAGVPDIGDVSYQNNSPINDVSAGTPDVGSPDIVETTLSISPTSITSGSPSFTNVVFLQDHSLATANITTALAEVGQTSFVFKGKVGALNSVVVTLSKNSVTLPLSKNSTTINLSRNSVG